MSDAFDLPVWVLDREGAPGNAPRVKSADHGEVLAMFTDEYLAKRFIEDGQRPGVTTFEIGAKSVLLGLLDIAQESGVQYVGIDCPAGPNPRNEVGRYYPIQKVIDAVRTLPDRPV